MNKTFSLGALGLGLVLMIMGMRVSKNGDSVQTSPPPHETPTNSPPVALTK